MSSKKTLGRVFGVICLLIILVISVLKVDWLLSRKESNGRYSSFLSEENDVDVLFIGSSHIRHGVFPMELWGEHGITAYNLSSNGSTIPVTYWTLVNALDYKTPKVVVMDIFDIWPRRVCSIYWGQVQDQFDVFPLSVNKYKMVKDLFRDKELTDDYGKSIYDRRWELLWDMGAYHTRWDELSKGDFYSREELAASSRVWKGASPLNGVAKREKQLYNGNLRYEPDELSKEYLIKIIELCDAQGIELLLVNTGYDCNEESKQFHDSVYAIADEYGIRYIDMTQNEELIDFKTDLNSTGENTHVNYSGAIKLTDYLTEELVKDFSFEDHRNDNNFSKWEEDYEKYMESKHGNLKTQYDLPNYLSFLYDKDYNVIIQVRNPEILTDNIVNMLANLGIKVEPETNLFCADLSSNSSDSFHYDWKESNSWDTCVGKLEYRGNNAGEFGLYLNGEELFLKNPEEDSSWIRVIAYSKYSGKVIDVREFESGS